MTTRRWRHLREYGTESRTTRPVTSIPGRRTPLTDLLVERIRREGPLTFAAFMEVCLYHPEFGYYRKPSSGANRADYFTSPELGPLFGRLLARQFVEMWNVLERPGRFDLVEIGAGEGLLARQVLVSVKDNWPEFFRAIRMTLVEVGAGRRQQSEELLEPFKQQVYVIPDLPGRPVAGCIYSNELLDAQPVHRVVQRAEGLREIFVGEKDGNLQEEEGALSSAEIADYLNVYGAKLEEGQLAEMQLASLTWLEQAAQALERGFLLTIDYGYRARELYGPGHQRGTILAYRSHHAHEDWLARPGEQDLTAHVNFTALEERGRELGLELLGLTSQTNFLLALARADNFAILGDSEACGFDQASARLAFKQLIHPAAMGETFKVLVQAKGVAGAKLTGLAPL